MHVYIINDPVNEKDIKINTFYKNEQKREKNFDYPDELIMFPKNFEIYKTGDTAVIKVLLNELGLSNSQVFMKSIEADMEDLDGLNLILDLDDLNSIDSAGITFLYSFNKMHSKRFKSLSVVCKSDRIHKMFSVFEMEKYIPIFASMDLFKQTRVTM